MKKNNSILYWGFWIFYLEIIYKIFILKDIFSFSTLYVLIFSMLVVFCLSLLTSIFNKKINKVISIILLVAICILYLAQIVYYNFYYSIFSVFSLSAGGTGQVFEFWTMILAVIIRIWYIFLLVIIPLILTFVFSMKFINFDKINLKILLNKLVLIIISLFLISASIIFDKDYYSLKRLLYETHAPVLTINKTGLFTMEVIDLTRFLFGFEEKPFVKNEDKTLYNKEDYNMMNINFKEEYPEMNKYFMSVKPTNKNEYTGIFNNKNIIFINTESFDKIVIDEKLTPTLYKITNDGFVFNNYYQPLYPISTFDGEYMNLFSLIPKEGTWSLSDASKRNMPFTFGNFFKNKGYNTYAFHNYVYNFYERQETHPNIGFKYEACGNGLENKMDCNNWPNSDLEMINSTFDEYSNDTPFAVYYMTVSGHLNYNFRENYISRKNKNFVDSLNYSERVKAYLATGIEVNRALESLIKKLEDKNILEDTVIILTPDHFPYGLTSNELNEVDSNDRNDKFELYHTSLIIYNPTIKHVEIDTLCSGIDILPTIYNLYGFEFDSRLLMGRDIFSDEEHIVILSDRSWITSKGTYNSITGEFKSKGEVIDDNYINRINDIINERISMSNLIINYDYYSELGF